MLFRSKNKAWYYSPELVDKACPVPESMQEEVALYKDQIAEAVAMGDDELMEKFFSGEEFSDAAIFMLLGGFMVYVGLYILVGAVFILFTPDISRRSAFKRCVNDVHNAFSEWLRDVALNLQQDTLRNSIKSSYDNCPAILKASLAQFIKELDETPGAVEPYYHFLSEFKILEISSKIGRAHV